MIWGKQHHAIAAWLAVVALFLNALVPIHLSFDLVAALNAGHAHGGHTALEPSHELLAKLVGYEGHRDPHGSDHHHRTNCTVCSSVSTLAAFATPSPAILPAPNTAGRPVVLTRGRATLLGASPACYRSRAPPLG
jgi:Protein of unknown function (DUF2946)